MCYYNGQKVTRAEYIRLKNLEKLVANYDFLDSDLLEGFDYKAKAVLKRIEGKQDFDITKMEWGFLPDTWYGKPIDNRYKAERFRVGFPNLSGKNEKGVVTLNAMGEELLYAGKIFRESALSRRCLIISTGFYEWRHVRRRNKRTGKLNKTVETYPYHISFKDKEYVYMAGIWKPWIDKETGEQVETCAIVTTSAEGHWLMERVHNSKKRMPTILNEDLAWQWMFNELTEKEITEIALTQYPSDQMQACPVAKDFRSSVTPTKPFNYELLPPLEDEEEGGAIEREPQRSLF